MKIRIVPLELGLLAAIPLLTSGAVRDLRNGPSVESVSPVSHVLSAERNAPIVIRFDVPVDPQTVTKTTVRVYGRWSGVVPGDLRVEERGRVVRFVPSRSYAAGEAVTVSLSRAIKDREGEPMSAGYAWSFWARAGKGTLDLTETQRISVLREGEDHVQPYGAYAGDFNGDGFSDLAVPNEVANDVRIFLNNGRGNYPDFTIVEYPDGAVPSPNEGADLNGDGIIDFVVGNSGNDFISVFIGEGGGRFRHDANYRTGLGVRGVCPMDLDGDAIVDVATANMRGSGREGPGDVSLLRNDGTGRFTSLGNIATNARAGKTCAAADLNGDGIFDLVVGAFGSREVVVFLGDGEGGLIYHTKFVAGGSPWMVVAADVNGDGHVDVLAANRRTDDNLGVLFGDGRGNLSDPVTYSAGSAALAVDVGDVDGDGDLDVVMSNWRSKDFTLFENAGDGTMINPRTLAVSASGSCAIIHDRDNDGDLDISGVDEIDDLIILFENR